MAAEYKPAIAQLANCTFTRLNIEAKESVNINSLADSIVEIDPELETNADNPNLMKLKLEVHIVSDKPCYDIEAVVEGVFLLFKTDNAAALDEFFCTTAPNMMFAFIKSSLISMTSTFSDGSLWLPSLEISFKKGLYQPA